MQAEIGEVPVTVVDTDDADARQQKCQRKTHVVVVVHRAEQHREYHDGVNYPGSGRQYVDSAALETAGAGVYALPAAGPVLGFAAECFIEALRDGVQGTGTDSSTKAAISGSG